MRLSLTFVLQLAATAALLPSLALAVPDEQPVVPAETEQAAPEMANLMDRITALSNKAIPVNTIPDDLKAEPGESLPL